MNRILTSVLLFTLGSFNSAENWAADRGSVCVAPVGKQDEQLDAETGSRRGYVSYEFTFRVGDGPWIHVPRDKPALVDGFDVKKRHLGVPRV